MFPALCAKRPVQRYTWRNCTIHYFQAPLYISFRKKGVEQNPGGSAHHFQFINSYRYPLPFIKFYGDR